LTYQAATSSVNPAFAESTESVDAGAPGTDPEIEITPAMLKAGVSAFVAYDARFEGPQEAVAEIYTAMRRAHQSSV